MFVVSLAVGATTSILMPGESEWDFSFALSRLASVRPIEWCEGALQLTLVLRKVSPSPHHHDGNPF